MFGFYNNFLANFVAMSWKRLERYNYLMSIFSIVALILELSCRAQSIRRWIFYAWSELMKMAIYRSIRRKHVANFLRSFRAARLAGSVALHTFKASDLVFFIEFAMQERELASENFLEIHHFWSRRVGSKYVSVLREVCGHKRLPPKPILLIWGVRIFCDLFWVKNVTFVNTEPITFRTFAKNGFNTAFQNGIFESAFYFETGSR